MIMDIKGNIDNAEYLAETKTIDYGNPIIQEKMSEKCGFELAETKMYKDIDDEKEELYRFYKIIG